MEIPPLPPLQKPAKKAATGLKHQQQATIQEMLANTRKSLDAASGKQPKTKRNSMQKDSNQTPRKSASTAKVKAKKPSPRRNRVPPGFSVRPNPQKAGQRPECRGCGKEIGCTEVCMRHRFKEQKHNKHFVAHQFHCSAERPTKMSKKHLTIFLETHISSRPVIEAVKQMRNDMK